MSIIAINKKTLNKFNLVKNPGWKVATCISINGPTLAASKKSNNYEARFEINTPTEDEGIEVLHFFNDSPYAQKSILNAIAASEGVTNTEDLFDDTEEIQIDLSNLEGKQLQIEVSHDTRDGKIRNSISDFAPAEVDVPI